MSKLNIDQQTVFRLFSDKKSDFLIPDYQRPYAWGETECQTLWEDIFLFAFPDDDRDKFKQDDEYFLGPIVLCKNGTKQEIIDGQQRLTTLMLLLRAFYAKFLNMQDKDSVSIRNNIAQCIWKTDEFGNLVMDDLKIDSQVSTDSDKEEFLTILKTGEAQQEYTSKYADIFRFFQQKIDDFIDRYPGYCPYLPARLMNNCIFLPIEAENQDTALRIFSTLNDRGLPLSDADIFKAQFYKFYTDKQGKERFIEQWKSLESLCEKIFHPLRGTPMDELFTRYMYYERAKMGIKSSTTEALRKFYERDKYSLLKREATFDNLIALAEFWHDVANQNAERFSDAVLRRLFVLNYAPNGMWTFFVSVYFMHNRNEQGLLEDAGFLAFLQKITAFIWGYALVSPGVNALRTPVYAEMVNIVQDLPVEFAEYRFDLTTLKNIIDNFNFFNGRPITKSMLAWWAFQNDRQPMLSLETNFDIEHIYPRNRFEKERTLAHPRSLELLGNKSLLESRINIRASDYHFADKARYYQGFDTKKGQRKTGTNIRELLELADSAKDFTEADILARNDAIIDAFLAFLRDKGLEK